MSCSGVGHTEQYTSKAHKYKHKQNISCGVHAADTVTSLASQAVDILGDYDSVLHSSTEYHTTEKSTNAPAGVLLATFDQNITMLCLMKP